MSYIFNTVTHRSISLGTYVRVWGCMLIVRGVGSAGVAVCTVGFVCVSFTVSPF